VVAGRTRREGDRVEQWSKIFGAHVRLKRVEMGFQTQQALAEYLGYATHGTISQIELGNVAANFDVACQLAVFLKISLDSLLGIASTSPPAASSSEWYRDMFMVRLPAKVYELWPSNAQQEILTRTVEEMGRAMRETMHPPPPGAAQDPGPDPADGPGPDPHVRPIRPSGTE
jgi:transcriptional regulator with XRE-family HTH domain